MKKCAIILFMSFCMAFLAVAQNEFTVPLSDPAKRGKLKVSVNYGTVTIKGTARKDVLVRYQSETDDDHDHDEEDEDEDEDKDKDKNNSSREGLRRIDGGGLDLEVSENANTVKVNSDSWNTKINLYLEVPSSFDVYAHSYNDGDVMVTNLQGDIELESYNGEITALNISGSVVASTYNGDIKATFDKVTENTPMSYSTYNGDIDLSFPAALKASFKMKTEQGEIYTGFDVKIVSTGPVQVKDTKSGVYRVKVDEWKRAEVNGGGPEFVIKNYNGDIYIRKK